MFHRVVISNSDDESINVPDENATSSGHKLKIGVVLSGGQAPGGHNVISGLFDYLQERAKGSTFYGFKGGPAGIMKCKYIELNAEYIHPYRNQGGFDMICSGRDKIETPEQFKQAEETTKKLDLDGLVVIGGDDSNTNACLLLAENFRSKNLKTRLIGCPKTIDGDLKCKEVPTSFGFDTACKVTFLLLFSHYLVSYVVESVFVRLMGRAASHITLECALQAHPNITIIGEEVAKIETEKMLIQMVKLNWRKESKLVLTRDSSWGSLISSGRCGLLQILMPPTVMHLVMALEYSSTVGKPDCTSHEEWALKNRYISPGPIQFTGPGSNALSHTLLLELGVQ
uniref:Phosphofructokinase domain-containing protein n=1 Tax=Brassica campestris TaxID=3711 RepID=M4DJX1_BRACM|nr:unnamed protein product [Brassica rapa]